MTHVPGLAWQPVTHGARTPIVVCWRCKARELNETNRLHRQGWEEVKWGREFVYRCGECAKENR
jgi:hypothetical protein